MPGMYALTSNPLVSLTRATFRRAEFGFFGVIVHTRVQVPRLCGQLLRAGVLLFFLISFRPLRTSWFMVGIELHLDKRETLLYHHTSAISTMTSNSSQKCTRIKHLYHHHLAIHLSSLHPRLRRQVPHRIHQDWPYLSAPWQHPYRRESSRR